MSWDDLASLESELNSQLQSFDWEGTDATCQQLIQRLRQEPVPPKESTARKILGLLRSARQFTLMSRVADAFLQAGQTAPQIYRQYAQSLIDQGELTAARSVLDTLVQNAATPLGERMEAIGLVGRLYKQAYVNAEGQDDSRRQDSLWLALDAYGRVYDQDRDQYLWHGINKVALLTRSGDLPIARQTAEQILDVLAARERQTTEPCLPAWDLATRLEAYVALGKEDGAEKAAIEYIRSTDVDAFALDSTFRQLRELWQLTEEEPIGARILPILRAALLKRQGAGMRIGVDTAHHDESAIREGLEKRFGADRSLPIVWYAMALDRCKGIARIEKGGKGLGTGWLARRADFFPGYDGDELLMVTNAHVVATKDERDRSLPPRPLLAGEAQANFQFLGERVQVKSVEWLSPVAELDASFMRLERIPKGAEPLPLSDLRVEMSDYPPAPRTYIIGYPGGRDLEISLYDNQLVGCNDTRLHYRTPTEPGSSGSPVFEPDSWKVVALHHSGKEKMERLDAPGQTYQANEGIAVLAIQKATQFVVRLPK
ncbi:MAG: serine protease [Candidatus Aminicenantales bacterium]